VLAVNNNRNFLLLQNDSDAYIYCSAATGGTITVANIAFFGVGFFNVQYWANGYWDMFGATPPALALHQGFVLRPGGPDIMLDYKLTTAAISCIAAAPNKNLLVTEGIQ